MIGQTGDDARNVEIMAPLKYLLKFWGTLETLLINWENNLILTWSIHCVTLSSNICNNLYKTLCSSSDFINLW